MKPTWTKESEKEMERYYEIKTVQLYYPKHWLQEWRQPDSALKKRLYSRYMRLDAVGRHGGFSGTGIFYEWHRKEAMDTQPKRHFFEWLGARYLYDLGFQVVVEKYLGFKCHSDDFEMAKRGLKLKEAEFLLTLKWRNGQLPDLFAYRLFNGRLQRYFVETKGQVRVIPKASVRSCERSRRKRT